ncbi:MAG: preQ(1) synthase [Verrucomicrobium sp.]|nr:preQ(1) synthase [Verrucomicrobium sp.]
MASKRPGNVSLLGRSEMRMPATPGDAKLETFPNPTPKGRYTVRFETSEFTSLCPVTGQPDFGTLQIEYRPAKLCVETKSLKFYLSSYRSQNAFCESVTNRILADFVAACSPSWAQITGVFASRGGIRLTVTAEHGKK